MPTLTGTNGNDTLIATSAADWTLIGNGGNDTLTGNAGNDSLFGGNGNDILTGGAGNDIFYVAPNGGFDKYNGGTGVDSILATADSTVIGISSIIGIETIDSGGFVGATIKLQGGAPIYDFTNVNLIGIESITGSIGNDRITGSAGNDVINGGGGADILNGGAGDDTFLIGVSNGFSRYNGGTGTNSIQATADNVQMRLQNVTNIQSISGGEFANVTIIGAGGSDLLDLSKVTLSGIAAIKGGTGNDTIIGSAGDDVIKGDAGDDRLSGGLGNDTIDGGTGNNVLSGGFGDDIFLVGTKTSLNMYSGAQGFDTIQATADDTVIALTTGSLSSIEAITSGGFANVMIGGTQGVDVIDLRTVAVGDGEIAAINGLDGNDTIWGSAVADTINGGTGDDKISGGAGDDIIDGGAGFDTLTGGLGADTVSGGIGDDIITASGGDILSGGDGFDTFLVGKFSGVNAYDGGTGLDAILASSSFNNIGISSIVDVEKISANGFANVNITGDVTGAVLDFTNVELVGINSLLGTLASDSFIGSAGDDKIIGLAGDDILNGGIGNDIIDGGVGLDTLTGGLGNDIFRGGPGGLNGDTITDFSVDDKIQIVGLTNPANVTFAFDSGTSILSIDPDGVGAQTAISLTLLGGSFDASGFHATSDGVGGTYVDYMLIG